LDTRALKDFNPAFVGEGAYHRIQVQVVAKLGQVIKSAQLAGHAIGLHEGDKPGD
jgi:hypothetical protein